MSIQETRLQEQIERGTELHVTARYFRHGFTDVTVCDTNVDTSLFAQNTKANLSGETWAFTAHEDSTGDTWYVLVDDTKANISYNIQAAKNGAFSPVYLSAFSIDG